MKKKILKSFKQKQKKLQRRKKFLLRHPLLMPSAIFLFSFMFGLIGFVYIGASTQGASDARIVDIFADKQKRTVTTRAVDVGDLLNRLEIPVADEDIVEPALNTPILEDNTQINIYRARPVEIHDGDRIITTLSAQRAPRLLAEDLGLDLYSEDIASFERTDTTLLETSASEQLVIIRSVEVQLNLYGVVKLVRTTENTVAEFLKSQNISPQENENIQPAGHELVQGQMLISVNRPGIKTLAVTEPIPFDVDSEDDPDLQAGKSVVVSEGIEGEKAVIYEIEEDDEGKEISRKQIQDVVVRAPVSKKIKKGTKVVVPYFNPSVTVAGDKASLMAAAGIAASDFGYVDFIISHESGWKPGIANRSSGAYGLCQSLPASKMASAGADYRTNPVTQLRWCSGYAAGRYGGWAGAYNAWLAQNWW